MINQKNKILRRYTNLPATIYMLQKEAITLLSPSSWDDKNDIYFLERYRDKQNLQNVLALYLTNKKETYHHWNVFAPNMDGVCIEFKKDELLNDLMPQGIIGDDVHYHYIKELKKIPPETDELPFLKRKPFQDDKEYRLIYCSEEDSLPTKDFPIDLSCINKIHFSPWMPINLSNSVESVFSLLLNGNTEIELNRSTLIENESWKRTAHNI
jgi:hypothetical protein